MPTSELEILLQNSIHEARAGALSIMDKEGRKNKTSDARRQELFDLYVRNTAHINNWDLVDVSCIYVVGRYLIDKPRDILDQFVVSENMWERRTAMVSTFYFLKKGELTDTLRIAKLLLNDPHDLIHKATGWGLRIVGSKDRQALLDFLNEHATTMPRTALRYAMEHLDPDLRSHYLGLKKAQQS